MDSLVMLARIALRNLVASRLKTFIVGGIIAFGAFLVVVGTAFLDSIDRSMTRSIVGSVAGNIQVYAAESKDTLTVMGSMDLEAPDLAPIEDFARLRDVLRAVPNVKAVVPMGINGAIVTSGNTIDVGLERLRGAVRRGQAGDTTEETRRAYLAERGHVRQMVKVLSLDLENVRAIQNDSALAPEDAEAVRKAASDAFWNDFENNPLDGLEFLENRIAPIASDADMLFLRYVGTDPDAFAKTFDRFRIVDGAMIPRGKPGFLFSKYMYEEQVKLKTALRLDKIKRGIENRGARIASDAELQRFVKENYSQVRELLLQLDEIKTERFRKALQDELGSPANDVGELLAAFFHTDDGNFGKRYAFFYRVLAPELDLYRVRIGDNLTIKAFTKNGYVQSINLPVYGTFEFAGLEGSPLAGDLNLMDLVSFRNLYGFLSDEKRRELAALKATIAARDVSRERAEAELFGAPDQAEPTAASGESDQVLAGLAGGGARRQSPSGHDYDPVQLETGVLLNAAVTVTDARPRALRETMTAIEAAAKRAGIPLKTLSWQEASGIIGQFVTLMRGVLFTAVLIIFVVALVIINNALVMATLERVREIGTLRAVGAQRRFVLGMLVVEGVIVGALFGAIGAAVGALAVAGIGRVGIPAFNDVATFFFSGPRLYPSLAGSNLVAALGIVMAVSLISCLYPAFLAMRVTPRQAMQSED